MTSKRLYFLFLGLIGLLLIALIAGTYGINGLLTTQASKLTAAKAKSLALAQEQLSLDQAKKDIKTYANLNDIAKAIVPEDKDQAEAVREIVNMASQYGISLASISFPASTLGLTPGGTGTSAAAASSSAAAAASSKSSTLSQLTAVKNIPGVYQLPITVNGDPNKPIAYDKFIGFLTALEHNRRTSQVSGITLAPSTQNHNLLSFNLNINEYIKP